MRRTPFLLPLFLLALSLPAFAAPPEAPRAAHRTQNLRPGQGEPRVCETTAARTAAPRKDSQAPGAEHTRVYRPAKPGEGAPKA